jgi:hypothetical protein
VRFCTALHSVVIQNIYHTYHSPCDIQCYSCYSMLQLSTFAVRLGVRWGLESRLARLLGPICSLLPNTKPSSPTPKSASFFNLQVFTMWGQSLVHGGVRREVGQKTVASGFYDGNGSHAANYGLAACATSNPIVPHIGSRCSRRYNGCGFLVSRVAQLS